MKKHKFKEGQEVKHNYSTNYSGQVHDVRDDPQGYDYLVRFIDEDDENGGVVPVAKDWFKEDVLVALDQSDKKESKDNDL